MLHLRGVLGQSASLSHWGMIGPTEVEIEFNDLGEDSRTSEFVSSFKFLGRTVKSRCPFKWPITTDNIAARREKIDMDTLRNEGFIEAWIVGQNFNLLDHGPVFGVRS